MTYQVSSLFIFSFILSYSLNTSTKREKLHPIYESVKDLEIEPCMQSKFVFSNNAISSCFLSFLLNIVLYFLTFKFIAQKFYLIVELIIPLEISTKEAKVEMEIHTVTAKN